MHECYLGKKSDFEINCKVADILGVNYSVGAIKPPNNSDILRNGGHSAINYCQLWRDTGPIIVEHEINLLAPEGEQTYWDAVKDEHLSLNKNPLRAVCEVFILMNQSDEWDHNLELIDDSFDHEFGTESIFYWHCIDCDAESGEKGIPQYNSYDNYD